MAGQRLFRSSPLCLGGEAFMQSFVLFHISGNNRLLVLPLPEDSRIRRIANQWDPLSFLDSHHRLPTRLWEAGRIGQIDYGPRPPKEVSLLTLKQPESIGSLTLRKASCCSLSVYTYTHTHTPPPYCTEINHRWNPHHM